MAIKPKVKTPQTNPSEISPVEPQTTIASKITFEELFSKVFTGLAPDAIEENKNAAKLAVSSYIQDRIEESPLAEKYNIVIVYDELRMAESDTDNIYAALTKFQAQKPILLILHSSGGYVGPAYLIGKLLQEHSSGVLDIVIPRRAKSAATLLCCAADHIHLGSMSELGPIDPQIDGLPALGLKSAIEHIAALAKEHPHAVELLSKYMGCTIQPIHLGHYERVAESAVQYAERLMTPHAKCLPTTPEQIARRLVYSYKDHGFVIDKQEAQEIFGKKIVQHNSDEYYFGNTIYQALDLVKNIVNYNDYHFCFNGSTTTGPVFVKRRSKP